MSNNNIEKSYRVVLRSGHHLFINEKDFKKLHKTWDNSYDEIYENKKTGLLIRLESIDVIEPTDCPI